MRKYAIVVVGLLVLAGCQRIDDMGVATAVPSPTSKLTVTTEAAATAVLTEQPVPPPPGNTPILAYPPPPIQPTLPYPGPPPGTFPTRIRPTPTPTIAIYPADDCKLHPSFGRCGGVSLTGKLAYLQTNGQLTVLDLDTETAWSSTQTDIRDVDWSPTGDRLLVHDETRRQSFLYHPEGRLLHNEASDWIMWAPTNNHLHTDFHLWNTDSSILASTILVETETTESGYTPSKWMVEVNFQDGTGRKEWTAEDSDTRHDVVALLDWVPQTDWVLLGYAYGGVATRIASGYRLMALNVRSGEIVDSGLSTPGNAQLDWHPSELGLLVTTDLHGSDVSGSGALALWHVLENRVTYPLESAQFVYSPVWSPDGRYIAYSAYDLSENIQIQLMILDTQTGATTLRAERGEFPAWSRDGTTIFYLEMESNRNPALVRAVGREQGEPLTVTVSRFPRCPGSCLPRTAFDYTPEPAPPPPQVYCPDPQIDDMVGTLEANGTVFTYTNPVLGIELTTTNTPCVHEPDYLADSYGFGLSTPDMGNSIFSAAWLYQATPDQLETIVQQTIGSCPQLNVTRETIIVDGIEGIALWPLPGTETNTQIHLAANDRLYWLIFPGAPLDERAQTLLDNLRFVEPTQSLDALDLPRIEP